MSAFVDTSIIVRHLTGDPPELAARATAYLGSEQLPPPDVIVAETLLALVALTTVGIMLVPVLVLTSFYQTQATHPRVAALGLTILLPVVAILMFTAEWSQRSVMVTFTQEPRRVRILNAKLAVSMMLSLGGALFGGLVAVAGIGMAGASGRTSPLISVRA